MNLIVFIFLYVTLSGNELERLMNSIQITANSI